MQIALIADSHLSERAPECVSNWQAAARAVSAADPDLTIHLGDIALDAQEKPEDLSFARGLVQAWPTPMVCVPGNHDVGTASGEAPLSREALRRYTATFGPDRWCLTAHGWTLIGLNAQLLGTGSNEEKDQRSWLLAQARVLGARDQVALFLHRPLRRAFGDTSMPMGRYVDARAARWLLDGPLRSTLRLVVSGHTHQSHDFVVDGVRHVWLPSSAFVIADHLQHPVGQKRIGIGWLSLDARGCECVTLLPPGSVRHELTELAFYAQRALHT
jgi:3',5'-cyclic AMP phosphodiesterase CpdA